MLRPDRRDGDAGMLTFCIKGSHEPARRGRFQSARKSRGSVSVIIQGMLRCSRGATAPEFLKTASLSQKRGDGAPGDATTLSFARLLAKAWRPPARRPAFSFGAGPRFPVDRLRGAASWLRRVCRHFWRPLWKSRGRASTAAPSASSWQAAPIGHRAEPRRRPSARLAGRARRRRSLHTSRRNRFASLMGADNRRYIIL
jgi:hypothetical protein